MSQKFLLGGVVAAFAAMAFALVLVAGTGTASANVLGLSASSTTVNPDTNGAVILTVDADNGDGNVRLIATGGDFEACTDGAAVACVLTGATVLEADADSDIDFTVDDGATNTNTLLVTWGSPTTGPASVALTAIQDNVSKTVTVSVRGTTDTVEIVALTGESTSSTSCQGTTAHVIRSTTATAANGGQQAAFFCILVKDSAGTRLTNQPVILSTSDGTLSTLTVTTTGSGGRATWDDDANGATPEVSAQLTAGSTGANGDTATVTASSGGKSATVDVKFGGDPASCTLTTNPATVQTGGSSKVSVNVLDSAGSASPDGLFVSIVQVNPGQGANAAIIGSPAALTDGMGTVDVIAAIPGFIALGGTAPVNNVGGSIAGSSPTITCTASVQATGTVAPPSGGTSGTGGFTGTAPSAGSIGLLVTSEASDAAGLIAALGTAGCTVESLAVLEAGTWKVYINGAPDVVNAAFPASLAATTPFFTRCA